MKIKNIINMNVAEILKDAPKGTKLYSTIIGYVELLCVTEDSYNSIKVKSCNNDTVQCFTEEGKYSIYSSNGECVLFPSKENRDWNTFNIIKPGDVIKAGNVFYIMKTEKIHLIAYDATHDIIYSNASEQPINHEIIKQVKIATQEEKNTLFKLIEKHGIKYNPIDISFEKVKIEQKYSFKPFDKVLVRNEDNEPWTIQFFGYYDELAKDEEPYICLGNSMCIANVFKQCIPFEGNEKLLGHYDKI